MLKDVAAGSSIKVDTLRRWIYQAQRTGDVTKKRDESAGIGSTGAATGEPTRPCSPSSWSAYVTTSEPEPTWPAEQRKARPAKSSAPKQESPSPPSPPVSAVHPSTSHASNAASHTTPPSPTKPRNGSKKPLDIYRSFSHGPARRRSVVAASPHRFAGKVELGFDWFAGDGPEGKVSPAIEAGQR